MILNPLDSHTVVHWAHECDRESRDLWSKYHFYESCPLLQGPELNPEIMNPSDRKKDSFLLGIHSSLGKGLASLVYALMSL